MSSGESTSVLGFVRNAFADLFAEVDRLVRRVAGAPPAPGEAPDATAALQPETALRQWLEERGGAAEERFGAPFASTLFREATYAMAALADERFVHLDWPGASPWRAAPLVRQLFGSGTDAASEIFARIDRLLAGEKPSPPTPHPAASTTAVQAEIYLLTLSLGFEGKFRGRPDGAERLAAYRRALYRILEESGSGALEEPAKLFPQAYEHTAAGGEEVLLPRVRAWGLAVALLALILVLASYPVWRSAVGDVANRIEQILELE